jgi:hypothetical protein
VWNGVRGAGGGFVVVREDEMVCSGVGVCVTMLAQNPCRRCSHHPPSPLHMQST